jgi:hypothetical protein
MKNFDAKFEKWWEVAREYFFCGVGEKYGST